MTLDEIRQLINEATPGPWLACNLTSIPVFKIPCEKQRGDGYHTVEIDTCDGRSGYNARFIAAARTLLPALLKVAEAARHWIRVAETEPTNVDEAYQWGNACMDAAKETKEALAVLDAKGART